MTQYILPNNAIIPYHKFMKKLLLIIWSLICASTASAQTITITDAAPLPSLLTRLAGERKLQITKFCDTQYALQIIDKGHSIPKYANLPTAILHTHCIMGTNGGFFDKDSNMSPMGLLITNGTIVSSIATNGFTASGILYDTGEKIYLKRRQNLHIPLHKIKQAIQSGPFLVENGRVVPGLNKTKNDMRTFIATDGNGNWCLGISTPITLHDLATWLTKINPGFKITHALNLDGGSSSAYYDSESSVYIPERKSVRNYIGIKPRNN